jgi:hypothetical protein
LPLAVAALAIVGLVIASVVWARLATSTRAALRARWRVGGVAGLVATVCYDMARYAVVAALSLSLQPFHVFLLFGQAFIGSTHSTVITFAVGAVYHVCNGTFFGLAYTVVVRRPSWWTGMVWGLTLEAAMAVLYPSWLRITMLREFLEVSALGHLVYGAVLGLVAAAGLRRPNDRWS